MTQPEEQEQATWFPHQNLGVTFSASTYSPRPAPPSPAKSNLLTCTPVMLPSCCFLFLTCFTMMLFCSVPGVFAKHLPGL